MAKLSLFYNEDFVFAEPGHMQFFLNHSYTELPVTLMVWLSAHLATDLLHCSTSCASTVLLMATALL